MMTSQQEAGLLCGGPFIESHRVLPFESFVPTIRGSPVKGAVLDPSAITGVGIALSLYDMQGKPNPHFGDGPFKISIEGFRVI